MKKIIKNTALLLLIVAVLMIAINKVIALVCSTKDTLPDDRGKYFSWKYGNIYYTKQGTGKPLLLVHDLTTSSSSYEWNRVIKKLATNHTVYAIDLLGCGRSEKPNFTYTNYMYVQLLNDFIKKVIGSKTSVVATGISVSFTVMACQMEPENYNKLIGISPADLYELTKTPGKRKNLLKFLIDMPVFGTFIYNMDVSRRNIIDKMCNEYFYKDHLVSDEIIDAYHKAAHIGDGHGRYLMASLKSHYTNINIVPGLSRINNSICLIYGKEHPYMADIVEEYQEYNAAIETASISGTCYLPQLETPGKLVKLLQILTSEN